MSLATVASVIGIGSGVKGLFGGGSGGGTSSGGGGQTYYVPTGQRAADQQWQDIMGQLQSRTGANNALMDPQMLAAYQQMLAAPSGGYTANAAEAGRQYGQNAGNAAMFGNRLGTEANSNFGTQGKLQGAGDTIMGQASPLFAAGNALWQTAQDPQNALRDKLLQQTTDASRAATSMRGLGMGAQAAGVENQDVQNMLINWQNQQLGRQATGLQGMAGAYGQAGNLYGQGANLYGQANNYGKLGSQQVGQAMDMYGLVPQNQMAAGQVPYQANLQAAQQPLNATNAYGSAVNANTYGPMGAMLSSVIPYLNYGQGAGNNAFNQQQTGLNNLTTGLGQFAQGVGSLGNMFNSGSYFGGGSGGGGYSGSNIPDYTNTYTGTQDSSGR